MSHDSEQGPESTGELDEALAAEPATGAATAGAPRGAVEPLGPVVSDAVERVVSVLRSRGRSALESGSRRARRRLDLYQARRDLDKLYQKLGREVIRLVEAGEIDHPGLVKGVERIRHQEDTVAAAAQRGSVGAAAEGGGEKSAAGGLAGSGEVG